MAQIPICTEIPPEPDPPTYSEVVLADGPVAFWPMDGRSGHIAVDLGMAGYDGSYNHLPVLVAGPGSEQATAFDGVDDQVYFGTGLPAVSLNTVITLEAWVYLNDNAAYYPITAYAKANGTDMTWEWRIAQTSGVQEILRADGGGFDMRASDSGVTAGDWHHVAVTVAGDQASDVKFYLGGVADGNPAGVLREGVSDVTSVGRIGTRYSQDLFLSGSIALLAVYDKVLTPTEILTHYTTLVP